MYKKSVGAASAAHQTPVNQVHPAARTIGAVGRGRPRQLGGTGQSFLWTLSNIALAASHNHYVMCRAASSGAGDSAESCWGEFF